MTERDKEIFERIKTLAKEDWFKKGEDAPDNIREEFEEIESDNDVLSELLELSTGGPGLTDVWISRGELIGDVLAYGDGLEDGEEVTEDDIYDDNQIWIADKRISLIDEINLGQFN